MKFSFFKPLAIILSTSTIFSCGNLVLPESVSIKSEDAKFSIPLGNAQFELAEKFNAEKVQSALGGEADDDGTFNICVYEFNPTKSRESVIEYVMNYPVEEQVISLVDSIQDYGTLSDSQKDSVLDSLLSSINADVDGKFNYPLSEFQAVIDTGINFKGIFESFTSSDDDNGSSNYSDIFNKIAFDSLTSYAYINVSDISRENAVFTGKIFASDKSFENVNCDDVSNVKLAEGSFSPVSQIPDLKSLADKKFIIEDDSFIKSGAYSVMLDSAKITNFVNGTQDADGNLVKHEKFVIGYKFKPTLKFSTKEELKSFLKKSEIVINVNVIIRFPLKLKVVADIEIDDILDMIGIAVEDDLLKREDGEKPNYMDYFDLVETMGFDYKFLNTTGLRIDASLLAKDDSGGDIIDTHELKFNSSAGDLSKIKYESLSFKKSEIDNIMNISPFKPKIGTVIHKTNTEDNSGFLSITRDSKLGIWGIFKATTNGSIEIWSKNN